MYLLHICVEWLYLPLSYTLFYWKASFLIVGVFSPLRDILPYCLQATCDVIFWLYLSFIRLLFEEFHLLCMHDWQATCLFIHNIIIELIVVYYSKPIQRNYSNYNVVYLSTWCCVWFKATWHSDVHKITFYFFPQFISFNF